MRLFLNPLILLIAIGFASALKVVAKSEFTGRPEPKIADERPSELKNVGIDEKVGTQLNLGLRVLDENGVARSLGEFFDGKTPVILSPVYYSCPRLCNFHLNGLIDGLKGMDWSAGKEFRVLALSFDAKENSDLAKAKKENYMKLYGRQGAQAGFSFLTADEKTIAQITEAIGFRFSWNDEQKEWAHGSAAVVLSPKGKVNRYLPGIVFDSKDIRLALNEATSGQMGTLMDRLVLYCFQYNPHQSKYTLYAFNVMKLGAGVMALFLGLWLIPIWLRFRREQQSLRSM